MVETKILTIIVIIACNDFILSLGSGAPSSAAAAAKTLWNSAGSPRQ